MNKKGKAPREPKKKKRIRGVDHSGDKGFNRVSSNVHGSLSSVLSNVRLSLTFRIAVHYGGQLLRTTFAMMLLMTAFLHLFWLRNFEQDLFTLQRVELNEAGEMELSKLDQERGVKVFLYPVRSSLDTSSEGGYSLVYPEKLLEGQFIVEATHESGQRMVVSFRLEREFIMWLTVMLTMLLIDLIRVVYFMRKRHRLSKSVLAPIRDITDMAATLSASNLSNRINIEGTKNELKDLAVVINSMLDRIERSYNSQKQFVSDASHELRTPIAVIQGYVNMLQRWGKSDPAVLDEGINAIAQETTSMKELVESLLFLARHDKKTLMMEMSSFDALDVVTELHREAVMVTPEDTFLLSPSDSCLIEADRGMVKQVLRILCDNAIKYTPKGGTITIGLEKTGSGCTLSIADNGSGISSEDLPKIFDRFYRSDSARKAENGGHGLGLSIARIIVMAHGGRMRVKSKLGVGTTFYVDLPASQHKQSAEPEMVERPVRRGLHRKKK